MRNRAANKEALLSAAATGLSSAAAVSGGVVMSAPASIGGAPHPEVRVQHWRDLVPAAIQRCARNCGSKTTGTATVEFTMVPKEAYTAVATNDPQENPASQENPRWSFCSQRNSLIFCSVIVLGTVVVIVLVTVYLTTLGGQPDKPQMSLNDTFNNNTSDGVTSDGVAMQTTTATQVAELMNCCKSKMWGKVECNLQDVRGILKKIQEFCPGKFYDTLKQRHVEPSNLPNEFDLVLKTGNTLLPTAYRNRFVPQAYVDAYTLKECGPEDPANLPHC